MQSVMRKELLPIKSYIPKIYLKTNDDKANFTLQAPSPHESYMTVYKDN